MTAVEHRSQGSPRAQGARLKRHRALKDRTRELRFEDSRHRIRWSRGLTSEDHASDLRFRVCKPENVPGFREIRSKSLRAVGSDLGVSNSRMSHEGVWVPETVSWLAGGISVLVDESVTAGRSHDLEVPCGCLEIRSRALTRHDSLPTDKSPRHSRPRSRGVSPGHPHNRVSDPVGARKCGRVR